MPIDEMLVYVWLRFKNGIRMNKVFATTDRPMFMFNWNKNRLGRDFKLDEGGTVEVLAMREEEFKKRLKAEGVRRLGNEIQTLCMFESGTQTLKESEVRGLLKREGLGETYRYAKIWSRVLELTLSILGICGTVYLIISPATWMASAIAPLGAFSYAILAKRLARVMANLQFKHKWFT